ncbi:hypothetical protein [Candidatus Magnetobacterium casense]|uniref:hypothetical protein n=1 Tax=Candidatus Magnetobacterium casense TaxID=1455061 RepID=UPI000695A431|nr:hypothetical protein [Candidatus Magnetobacterium casensis]
MSRHVFDMTPFEIQKTGWNVLKDNLGIAGALRFLLQYEKGEGDYTEMRKSLFNEETVDNLVKEIKVSVSS